MEYKFELPAPRELEPLEPYVGVDAGFSSENMYVDPGPIFEEVDKGVGGDTAQFRRPLQPYNLLDGDSSGDPPSVYITPGYFIHTHFRNAGYTGGNPASSAAAVEIPEIEEDGAWVPIADSGLSDSSGENWSRPRLTLPADESYIYLYFHTDEHGWVCPPDESAGVSGDPAVQIISSEDEKETVHHIPPDEDGTGGNGEYYIQIAKVTVNDDDEHALVHEGRQDNFLWQEAFVLQNVGAGANIFKEFNVNDDTNDLRTPVGNYAITAVESGDDIDIHLDAATLGAGVDVYIPELDGDKVLAAVAEFRSIAERASNPQVRVAKRAADGTTIQVEGNGVDRTYTFDDCNDNTNELIFVDGLLSSGSAANFTHYGQCNDETSAPE